MNTTQANSIVRLTRHGPPSVLEYTIEQIGLPKPHEVLIRHEAIAFLLAPMPNDD